MKKSYFDIQTPKGPSTEFRKHAYELEPPNNFTLIHYLGDEGAATDFPHGNKRNDDRAHVRTCPSLIKELTTKCQTCTTSRVYKSAITTLPPVPHMPVLHPRNSKQVENIRMNQLRTHRISHDSLYNLHELALDIPTFIHAIRTHPDLVCVCGQKALFQ